jgi:hypothetical protein
MKLDLSYGWWSNKCGAIPLGSTQRQKQILHQLTLSAHVLNSEDCTDGDRKFVWIIVREDFVPERLSEVLSAKVFTIDIF